MANNEFVTSCELIAKATDPIYIGTGGYTIGRVDNTIVRDPITKIPKIPGTSVAGTWRYFMALELQGWFHKKFDEIKQIISSTSSEKDVKSLLNRKVDDDLKSDKDLFENRKKSFILYAKQIKENIDNKEENNNTWYLHWGNLISSMNCAGQDDLSTEKAKQTQRVSTTKFGHCGHCIVCKSFGYAKSDKAEQGLLSFTDLNILFFPVYTRLGTRWITSKSVLNDVGLLNGEADNEKVKFDYVIVDDSDTSINVKEHINLGWIYLPISKGNLNIDLSKLKHSKNMIDHNQIVIVPDDLLSQIINSNLEVRTSVSIDPNTGAAKQGALFTSEAIPRATYFYGKVHIFQRLTSYLDANKICEALKESKKYYETLGIGGMTTRGFGRLRVEIMQEKGGKSDTGSKTAS